MSGPSFSNIDLWLFELEEGNLSDAQIEQLELFLFQHPEFDVDRDVWKKSKVQKTEMIFPNQDMLIKKREIAWFHIASVASIFLLLFSLLPSMSNFSENKLEVSKNHSQQNLIKNLLQKEIGEIRNIAKNNFSFDMNGNLQNNLSNKSVSTGKDVYSLKSIDKNNIPTDNQNTKDKVKDSQLNFGGMEKEESIHWSDQISNQKQIVFDNSLMDESNLEFMTDDSPNNIKAFQKKSNHYSKSFQKKLRSFTRKIERMANNPVALKNYREPDYHIPGLLNNDVNFSSTGTMLANRFQALSRIQWLGEENEQFMNQIAFDGYSNVMKGGIGVQLNHTIYANGGINVSNIAITYSPKLSLTKTVTFEPSIRFKMGKKVLNYQRMLDVDRVEIERQNAQSFYTQGQSPSGQNLWYKDLGVGLMVNTEWFYVSAQVDNLFRHTDNIYENDLPNKRRARYYYSFTAGTDWVSKNKKMSLSPYLVFQNNERLSEVWLGANYRLNWFTIGASVSSLLDPTASIGLKFKHFSIQYTADYLTSEMTQKRSFSHQLTLRIVGKPNRFGKRMINI